MVTAAYTVGTASVQTVAATAVGRSGTGAPGAGTGKALVLYDSTGPYGWLGEMYGIQTVNLASHFGAWTAHPVGQYTAGELNGYRRSSTSAPPTTSRSLPDQRIGAGRVVNRIRELPRPHRRR
jgi:hypothetical protein